MENIDSQTLGIGLNAPPTRTTSQELSLKLDLSPFSLEQDFREFTFTNVARLHTRNNPDFFKSSVVERAVADEVSMRFPDVRSVTLLCGRFEGIDERLFAARGVEEVSIGDFVLAGGEIAAMAMIEAGEREGKLKPDGVLVSNPPTKDPKVRQAIAAAVDPKVINDRGYQGKGLVGTQLFQSDFRWFPDVAGPKFDVELAKKLVTEAKSAGWDGRFVFAVRTTGVYCRPSCPARRPLRGKAAIGIFGTLWILLIAYVTMYLPYGMRFASGGNATDQFIELYNAGSGPVDISDWRLSNTRTWSAPVTLVTIPDGTTIAPRSHYLLGLANSGLAAPAAAGSTTINLRSTTGLSPGTEIVVGGESLGGWETGWVAYPPLSVRSPLLGTQLFIFGLH